jgi:hypothetical protein
MSKAKVNKQKKKSSEKNHLDGDVQAEKSIIISSHLSKFKITGEWKKRAKFS